MAMDFVAHITMLHGLHPLFNKGGGNPPFWTLAREEYFYIMYFGLLAARHRFSAPACLVGVAILGFIFPAMFIPWLAPHSSWWVVIDSSAIVLWIQWVLGFVAVEAYCGLIELPAWCRAAWAIPLWTVLALMLNDIYAPLTALLWGMVFFASINYCVNLETAARWPENRLINWLSGVGTISYSLYLVHSPIKSVVKQAIGPLGTTSNPALYLAATAIITLASYYSAKIFFALVESKFLHFKSDSETKKDDHLGDVARVEVAVAPFGGD